MMNQRSLLLVIVLSGTVSSSYGMINVIRKLFKNKKEKVVPKVVAIPKEWERKVIKTETDNRDLTSSFYIIPESPKEQTPPEINNALVININHDKNVCNLEDLEEIGENEDLAEDFAIEFSENSVTLPIDILRALLNQNPCMLQAKESDQFICPLPESIKLLMITNKKNEQQKTKPVTTKKKKRRRRRKKRIIIHIRKSNKPSYLDMLKKGLNPSYLEVLKKGLDKK